MPNPRPGMKLKLSANFENSHVNSNASDLFYFSFLGQGACHHNTQLLPDSVLNFIRGHPLMDEAVRNDGNINDQYYSHQGECLACV